MKKKIIYGIAGVFITFFSISSCKKAEIDSLQLSVPNIIDTILEGGGSQCLSSTCTAECSIDTIGIVWR